MKMPFCRALACAAIASVMLAACSEPSPPPPAAARDPLAVKMSAELAALIAVGVPSLAEVRESMRVPGRIEADETRMARIGAPVTGRITDLAKMVGQDVQRGQVLAKINSTELSTAQLNFLRALSQRQLAARAGSRAQQLYDAEVIGFAELQRRQSELTLAEAEVSAAGDQLKVLGMPSGAISRLAETRNINSITQIVATVSGTVIERRVTEGQVVQPADTVFLVADLSQVWVVADIPEQNAGLVKVGESVTMEVPALPGKKLGGTLAFVSPVVNPETRTVRARLDLPNADRAFKPAMLASVVIKGQPQKRMVVPADAVVREENRDYVFVQTDKENFMLRPVTTGAEYEGKRVVLQGLREDEKIVVQGAFHLNNERKRRLLDGK
jgi:cobalt-zinc-cadmium efflux system membrane fusion protein